MDLVINKKLENPVEDSDLTKALPTAAEIEITPLNKYVFKATCIAIPSIIAASYILPEKYKCFIPPAFAVSIVMFVSAIGYDVMEAYKAVPRKECILFSPITGNPARHMSIVAFAINKLTEDGFTVNEALISLSDHEESSSEVPSANSLRRVIQAAEKQGIFGTTAVRYWDDQAKGRRAHPASYRELAQSSTPVFFVATRKNCISMKNWPKEESGESGESYIERVIVVSRDSESSELPPNPNGSTRIFV